MLFLILSVLAFNAFAYWMPKKVSKVALYSCIWFALYMQNETDVYLNIRYNLYGYFSPGVDLRSLICIWGLYPALAMIILNFFPFNKSWLYKIAYSIFIAGFCTLFEWFADLAGFFYHNGWKYRNSFFVYIAIVFVLALHGALVRRFLEHGEK